MFVINVGLNVFIKLVLSDVKRISNIDETAKNINTSSSVHPTSGIDMDKTMMEQIFIYSILFSFYAPPVSSIDKNS